MPPRAARRLAATSLLALAVTTASCSSGDTADGSGEPASDGTSSAADPSSTTSASGSSGSASGSSGDGAPTAPTQDPSDTGDPFDHTELTERMRRAVDAAPTAHVFLTAESGTGKATAEGDQDLSSGDMDMDIDLGGQKAHFRLVDGTYYVEQGPKWAVIDEDTDDPVQQPLVTQARAFSLKRQFDAFTAGVVEAGSKGEDEVDGVATTHYTATVDVDEALAVNGEERQPGQADTLVYDVWLDEEDHIRRFDFEQTGLRLSMTADDWGVPVDIEKPADADLATQG